LGQQRAWYKKVNGAFTYYDDFCGFNFPTSILKPFFVGLFDPLSPDEKEVLNRLKKIDKGHYFIATAKGDLCTFKHELAHAFYYLHPQYKKAMDKIVDKLTTRERREVRRWLKESGYAESAMLDEMQAYISADHQWMYENDVLISPSVHYEAKEILDKYISRLGKVGKIPNGTAKLTKVTRRPEY
jgi:hypothetical protein